MKELRIKIELCRTEIVDLIERMRKLENERLDLYVAGLEAGEDSCMIQECRNVLYEEIQKTDRLIRCKKEKLKSLNALYDELSRRDYAPYRQVEISDYVDSIRKDGYLIAVFKI